MGASFAFERIARNARISTTRLHDCRHTAATTRLLAGVDVRTMAGVDVRMMTDVLAYAAASTTLNPYGHLVADAQRDPSTSLGSGSKERCYPASMERKGMEPLNLGDSLAIGGVIVALVLFAINPTPMVKLVALGFAWLLLLWLVLAQWSRIPSSTRWRFRGALVVCA